MEKYNPAKSINSVEWLDLGEAERIDLVRMFHEDIEEEMPDDALAIHASVHVVVENQIAKGVELVVARNLKLGKVGETCGVLRCAKTPYGAFTS